MASPAIRSQTIYSSMLFDESALRKLTQLSLVARQARAGSIKGERRSTKRGSSVEFADYRNYTPGDDLRRLDWNVFARLERPFIKMMEEEEDLVVYLLLDVSRSMDWGSDDNNKLKFALHIAAALGAIGLGAGDRVCCILMNSGQQLGPLRGPQQLMRLVTFLEQVEANQITQDYTELNQALLKFSRAALRSGLVFILSDLFDPKGFNQGINALLGRNYEVSVLQILCPDELNPPLAGDLRLVDIESGQAQELSVDAGMRALYQHRLEAWRGEIQANCRKRGVHYLLMNTAETWDKMVLFDMRQAGLVK